MRRYVRFWCTALVLSLAFVLPAPARAGSDEKHKVGVERYGEQAIREFALRVNDQLDRRKVNVALIARAGRPRTELPPGVSYTHVAFIVFEAARGESGPAFYTYTVYNLYQGDNGRQDRSYLKQDLTYNLVAGVYEPDIGLCVPVDVLQQRILKVIRSPAYRQLHTPDYNLIANPWVDRYDNCVTHTLKICVAAIYDTSDRARIYENIRSYFHPTPVRLGLMKTIGSAFMADVRREDSDPSGLQTATWESLTGFLRDNALVKESFTVRL